MRYEWEENDIVAGRRIRWRNQDWIVSFTINDRDNFVWSYCLVSLDYGRMYPENQKVWTKKHIIFSLNNMYGGATPI